MANFYIGETVIIKAVITDLDGNWVDPSTFPTVTIIDPKGQRVVEDADMTKEAAGKYHYDHTIESALGRWVAWVTALEGTRVSIEKTNFTVELGVPNA